MAAFLKRLSSLLLAGACIQSASRAETTIDVMILFDQSAAEYLNVDTRTIAQQAVGQLNAVFSNSGLRDVKARLVYQGKVDYRTQARPGGVGIEKDLRDLTGGKIKNALELRNRYGADLVTLFVHYPKEGETYTAGLGTALYPQTPSPSETCAFNIVLVDTVREDNITYPHEIGHQMGCGHNDLHAIQTGPQYHNFSSGFYNLPTYGTLMCYNFFIHKNDRERNIIFPIRIRPYLSNPDIRLEGYPLGDASHNNAETCRRNAPKVAQYRQPGRNAPKAPENDHFASAIEITGWETVDMDGKSVSVTLGKYVNLLATREQGEPLHGVSGKTSVWFRFVPPEDGVLEAATIKEQNSFVPFLAVYTGTSIRDLRPLTASGSFSCPPLPVLSKLPPSCHLENPVQCAVRKGQPVFLAVDGRDGDAGQFCLVCAFSEQELPAEEPPAPPSPDPSPNGNGPETPPAPRQPEPPSGGNAPAPGPAAPPQTPPQGSPPAPAPVHGGDGLMAALFLLSGGMVLIILLQLRILSRQKSEAAAAASSHPNAWEQEEENAERPTSAQGEENSASGGLQPRGPEPGGTRVVPGLARPSGPVLIWSGALSSGEPAEYRIPLEYISQRGRYSIGRAPDNDLNIPDSTVSSFHAVLELRGGVLHIGDMGSANGTMVNNLTLHRKEFAKLRAGDRITLGHASFLLSQSLT